MYNTPAQLQHACHAYSKLLFCDAVAMYPLPPKEKHADFADMSAGEYELLSVLVKATHSLLGAVRRQAKRSFHDWLTATREGATQVADALLSTVCACACAAWRVRTCASGPVRACTCGHDAQY